MDERDFDDRGGGGDGWPADASGWVPDLPLPDAPEASPPPPRFDRVDPAVEVQHEIDRLTAVARAKAAAVAVAEAELVDAVAALRAFEGTYLATWRQWVSWQCGLTSGETARVCRLADKLPTLPRIDAALRSGTLSAGVTEVLAREATAETEVEILAAAEVATGRQLQQLVRDYRQARRVSKKATPCDDNLDPATAPSEVSWWWDDTGRYRGHWNLRPDEGATLEAALEAVLARLRPSEAHIDHHHPDNPAASADPTDAHHREHAGADSGGGADDAHDEDDPDSPRAAAADSPDSSPGAEGVHHGDDAAASAGADRGSAADADVHHRSDAPDDAAHRAGVEVDHGAGVDTDVEPDRRGPPGAADGISEGTLREDEKPRSRRSDALVGLANTMLADTADDGLLPESTQIILHRNLTPTGTPRADSTLTADLPDLHAAPEPPDQTEGSDTSGRHASTPCAHCGHQRRTGDTPDTHDGRDGRDGHIDSAPHDGWHTRTTLPGCGTLDPRIAELLACDGLRITVDMIAGFPASEPIAEHSFNRRQRRAMRARDRHCRFPGCTRTHNLHAHHTKPYATTRRTTIADAVLLCGQHHLLIHLRDYTITLGTDHRVTITRTDGSILRGTALPPPATIATPADIPADRRLTGTADPLTHYARDVLIEHWLNTEPDDTDPPDDPDGPPGDAADPDPP